MSDWDEDWEALQPRKRGQKGPHHIIWIFAATLVLMLAMLAAIQWRRASGADETPPLALAKPGAQDTIRAHFTICRGTARTTCVVDGDTIWLNGEKIRLADINAPEVSEPQCDAEQVLGEKAGERLIALLNAGPFSLASTDLKDADKYGRDLREIRRGGQSLGMVLVSEGLAEPWTGHRRDWCQ